jgi:hypothetical protein
LYSLACKIDHRKPRIVPAIVGDLHENLGSCRGIIECEPPSADLHSFVGKIVFNERELGLNAEHLLLKGARLKDTDAAYGVCVYAGQDTRMVMNQKVCETCCFAVDDAL